MKTIVSTGPQTDLEVVHVKSLSAGAGAVVVSANAIGVGRVDLIMRQVIPGTLIPGVEVAGIVIETGPGVDPQWLGRRVFARLQTGAYAEQVAVSSDALVVLPAGLSFEAAVASGINSLVAHLSIAKAHVTAGERVLVRGADGGIGHLVVQIAANIGAEVLDSSLESPPASADVVIDLVAGSDTGAFVGQLNANGRYVIAGIASGMPPADFASSLIGDFRLSRSVATLSLDTVSKANLNSAAAKIFAEVAAGKLKPVVAHTLTLEQAGEAHHLLAKRRATRQNSSYALIRKDVPIKTIASARMSKEEYVARSGPGRPWFRCRIPNCPSPKGRALKRIVPTSVIWQSCGMSCGLLTTGTLEWK